MIWKSGYRMLQICIVCVCLGLIGCTTRFDEISEITSPVQLDRKIQLVTVSPVAKEQVKAVVFVFLEPVLKDQSPEVVSTYKTSGALSNAAMTSFADRAIDFFKVNGVNAEYVIKVNPGLEASKVVSQWALRGFHALVFAPAGGKLVTKGGVPYSAKTNYKVVLYGLKVQPMMEFEDGFSTLMYTRSYNDTILAGWMNTLAGNGYVTLPHTPLKQPI